MDRGVQGAPRPLSDRLLSGFALSLAAAIVLIVVGVAALTLLVAFSMAGENTVRIENGERVADFGLPLRFATAHYQEGFHETLQAGDDGVLNPWEIDTTGSAARLVADYLFFFALCLIVVVVGLTRRPGGGRSRTASESARRRARARLPRPSARRS